jgi:hypothetical protein
MAIPKSQACKNCKIWSRSAAQMMTNNSLKLWQIPHPTRSKNLYFASRTHQPTSKMVEIGSDLPTTRQTRKLTAYQCDPQNLEKVERTGLIIKHREHREH